MKDSKVSGRKNLSMAIPGTTKSGTSDILFTLAMACGPIAGIGFGRFAYALLLPSMRDSLHWSLSVSGLIGSVNAIGYLVGAILAASIAKRFGTGITFRVALLLVAISNLSTAFSPNLVAIASARFFSGALGAICYIAGAGFVMQKFRTRGRIALAANLGIYVGGVGLGIIVSGLAISAVLSMAPRDSAWQDGWVLLGILSFLCVAVSWRTSKQISKDHDTSQRATRLPSRTLLVLYVSYGLFGVGYITYMTFIVVYLKNLGSSEATITLFWSVLGVGAILGTFFWSRLVGRSHPGRTLALINATVALGAVIPLLYQNLATALISALLFGGSFLSVVSGVAEVGRRKLDSAHWTQAMGALTVLFAIGQIIGPILGGFISSGKGGLSVGLGVSAAILFLGALIALVEREPAVPHCGT